MNKRRSDFPTIHKAVFPVAGLGTRFLPATKATPKEMMPIIDTPLIQYAVDEALSAGIKELIFITSNTKRAIEDHFDSHVELEAKLAREGKEQLLAIVKRVIPRDVTCIYIRQPEPLGLGHAILCAQPVVGQAPFAVLLADDLIDTGLHSPCLKQMVQQFEEIQSSMIAVQAIDKKDTEKYGIIGSKGSFSGLTPITEIIEKPKPELAPSHFGAVGRYILTPGIFKLLDTTTPGKNGEIQLTDAIAALLHLETVYAFEFLGKRYDCGDKLGYLQAIVSYGLKHPEVGPAFQTFIAHYQREKA